MTVQLDDLDVLYLQAQGGVAGAAAAMQRVEAALPTMRGRKFYGVCYDPDDDFRACVAVKEGDEAASFGLHRGVVPGGWYATAKVSTPDDIPAAMQSVSAEHGFGDSRPSIEFYHSEIRLY